jgi:4-hydroxybenzoate polyprenyltransferase
MITAPISERPIVVDLDGTLVKTDMLVENLFLFLKTFPFRALSILVWLLQGKVTLKRNLANAVLPPVTHLPYNQELLQWLEIQKREGVSLILATASDLRIANAVAAHLKIFSDVLGTENQNLSSRAKRDALVERYGERGFDYIGNSKADLAVWKSSEKIYVVNPDKGVLNAAKRISTVSRLFEDRGSYLKTLAKALRLHQWSKNLLIFVPLLASHRLHEIDLILKASIAFVAFGVCASSVYLLNDLIDVNDDRGHSKKMFRPIAAGTLSALHAIALVPVLLLLALALALAFLPINFFFVLCTYYLLTLAYSFYLKRVVMLDVVCLSLLYTSRVIAGAAALALTATFWILAFCMFIFLSLAFVKRYAELFAARSAGKLGKTAGRGYYTDDLELLASLGGASGYISTLVLALYINESAVSGLYRSPSWMWAACPLLLYWLGRVWLLAHRGQMNDDPVVFAIKDSSSRWIGILFLLVFGLATI